MHYKIILQVYIYVDIFLDFNFGNIYADIKNLIL